MTDLATIVERFRAASPNIAAAFDEVQRRLLLLEGGTAPVFGTDIPRPFPELSGTDRTVRTWPELQAALLVGGRIRVLGRVEVPATVVNATAAKDDTHLWGDWRQGDGIKGRVLVNANRVRVKGLEVFGSVYDGVKVADGRSAANVDIVDCWIHDVGDQGVLSGASPSSNIWVRRCRIEKVGLTDNPTVQYDGHGIYMGGPTSGWTVEACDITANLGFPIHAYPKVTDVLVSGCTLRGGQAGGLTAWGDAKRVRFVGNVVSGAKQGAFEVGPNTPQEGVRADDTVWVNSPAWSVPGYPPIPGENNARDVSPSGLVKEARWPLLSPVLLDGSPRTSADAGAS